LAGLWLAVFFGLLTPPRVLPVPAYWHAHEMLFGFAAAAVAGFLLTASQNWAKVPGVKGARLKGLAALWLAGRLLPWALPAPSGVYAVVDLAFLPLTGYLLTAYLCRPGQERNRGLLGLLGLLAGGNLLVHLDALAVLPGEARRGLLLGLDTLVALILVIGGRVIPLFTRNAVAGARIQAAPAVSWGILVAALAFTLGDLVLGSGPVVGTLAAVAAAAGLLRFLLWDPWSARHNPMLWVLFTGYGWVIVGLALRAAAGFLPVSESLGIHAEAVGGIGVIVCGMMSRVSLGHTGRKIYATRILTLAFVLVNLAAFARVVLAGLLPGFYRQALLLAGTAWIVAFVLFTWSLGPVLLAPRADGRAG
jgi:uncharacterized protein involved in response to NO